MGLFHGPGGGQAIGVDPASGWFIDTRQRNVRNATNIRISQRGGAIDVYMGPSIDIQLLLARSQGSTIKASNSPSASASASAYKSGVSRLARVLAIHASHATASGGA